MKTSYARAAATRMWAQHSQSGDAAERESITEIVQVSIANMMVASCCSYISHVVPACYVRGRLG